MKKFMNWQVAGFAFSVIVGTFFHFIFDLTDRSIVTAFISPVNESIWEHLKLLYFPMLLFSFVEYRYWEKRYEQFWCVKLKGILLGMILVPTIYYTYTGLIGKSMERHCKITSKCAFVMLCVIGIIFWVITFYPPKIPLFQDPITKNYGYYEIN